MASGKIEELHKKLNDLIATANEKQQEELKKEFTEFSKIYQRFLEGKSSRIQWNRIKQLSDDAIVKYENLIEPSISDHAQMLNKLVVIKLNGGLGTSMGCTGPKSQIVVKDNRTFLELTVEQINYLNHTCNVKIPLVFMNSFNTDDDTENVLANLRNPNIFLYSFLQSCYPRIAKDTLMPIASTSDIKDFYDAWYPPGHGDFYTSFWDSGLLERLINEGKEYCFVSNVDNLGATVDLKLLNLIMNNCDECEIPEFVMEVTEKTRADVKGGTLILYEGKVSLLELAQVPDENVNDFKSVKYFKYFNTNNLWISLKAINRLVTDNKLNLDIIINNKSLSDGTKVIQLETAVGAAMKYFNKSIGVKVPRSRFLPVKKCSDLVLVKSNLYENENGSLIVSPKRTFPNTPILSLDEKYFKTVAKASARFKGIPDLIELDLLIVTGDVTFGQGVILKGTVVIVANEGCKIDIPNGAILENNVIEGDLRIGEY